MFPRACFLTGGRKLRMGCVSKEKKNAKIGRWPCCAPRFTNWKRRWGGSRRKWIFWKVPCEESECRSQPATMLGGKHPRRDPRADGVARRIECGADVRVGASEPSEFL